MRYILAGVCSVRHTVRDLYCSVPFERVPRFRAARHGVARLTTELIYPRLIGRDIPLHSLAGILTIFGVRWVEASRSGRGAADGAGAGPATPTASIVRALAALNSLQIAHAACVLSGSEECSERWRA